MNLHKPAEPRIALILGLPFHAVTMAEVVDDCDHVIQRRRPEYYVTPNLDFVTRAYNDPDLRNILFYARRIVCDGMPLIWLSRFFKAELPERIAGSDLVFELFRLAHKKGYSLYFLGSDEPTLRAASLYLDQHYPNLEIKGHYAPPIAPVSEWDNGHILSELKNKKPDILLVCVGCPKQERWIYSYFEEAGVPVSIGVGASLDFIAGKQVRAPKWMQKTGMEWFWRLINDPGRLFKRYACDFFYLFKMGFLQWRMVSRKKRLRKPAEGRSIASATSVESLTRISWIGSAERSTLDKLPLPENYDHPVVIDCSQVNFMDSSGLGRLAHIARNARDGNTFCVIYQPTGEVADLIKTMRLEQQLPMAGTEELLFDIVARKLEHFVQVKEEVESRSISIKPVCDLTPENIIQLDGRITQVMQGMPSGWTLYLDLSVIDIIDSYFVSRLLNWKKTCRLRHLHFWVDNPGEFIVETLTILKLKEVFLKSGK